MPKKKSKKAAGNKAQTKSGFVRSLPTTLSAKEVVAKAKEAGLTLTPKHVYNARAAAKGSGAGRKRKSPAGKPAKKAVVHAGRAQRVDGLLLAVAAELGLANSIGILEAERRKVLSVLGG